MSDTKWECGDNLIASEENIQKYKLFTWISKLVVLLISCFGLIANGIAVPIVLRRENNIKNTIKPLLCLQITFDSIYLICNVLDGAEVFGPLDPNKYIWAIFFHQLKRTCFCCLICAKLLLIRENCKSTILIRLPRLSSKKSWIYTTARVILIVTCSIIISIPLSYEMRIISVQELFGHPINDTLGENNETSDIQQRKDLNFYDDYTLKNLDEFLDAKTNDTQEGVATPFYILLPTELRFNYHSN